MQRANTQYRFAFYICWILRVCLPCVSRARTHTHTREIVASFSTRFQKRNHSINRRQNLDSIVVLTVRRLLRFPDESATMKVNSASFLLHHERVQEHSPGGLVRDLLHHTDRWFWLPFHASSFNGRTAAESFPRRLIKRHANDDRRGNRERLRARDWNTNNNKTPTNLARSLAGARLRHTIDSTRFVSGRGRSAFGSRPLASPVSRCFNYENKTRSILPISSRPCKKHDVFFSPEKWEEK